MGETLEPLHLVVQTISWWRCDMMSHALYSRTIALLLTFLLCSVLVLCPA